MTKVSIIMPVYNAEKHLRKAIDSIIAQTLQDWEFLLVDDGSTDASPRICDEYAAKDARIKVIHQQNQGVAMARQTGMRQAKGEYSIHADADDWTEPTMLEELYGKAKSENADMVIADYFVNADGRQTISKQCPLSLEPLQVLMDVFGNKLFGALWNKLIRTDLYQRCHARFFAGINHCEDLLICVQLLQNKNFKITYLPKAFYHYCMYPTSITHNYTYETYNMRIRFRNKMEELLKIPNAKEIIDKVSFGIFTEAFIYDVLSEQEVKDGLKRYGKQIQKVQSSKWRLGFYLLSIGFTGMAHKLIHY